MFSKIIKIVIAAALGYVVFLATTEDSGSWTRVKFYRQLLTKPIEQIRDEYANKSCKQFSVAEKNNAYFEAFVTGYCKPQASKYEERKQFLCSVALNCSCPTGKNNAEDCSSTSLSWKACNDFDETKTPYCHQTASTLEPKAGHVAADWSCFPKGTSLNIENETYKVTDRGGVIKGRRIDIWFDDCDDALKATGIYRVTIPKL